MELNREQLIINNLGLDLAEKQIIISELRADLEIKEERIRQLQNENDSLRNSLQTSENVTNKEEN